MSAPISLGEKFVVLIPIAIAEDLEWPRGTVVECVEIHHGGGEFRGCEMQHDGVDASFAAEDVFGEFRWFDPAEPAKTNPFA